MGTWQLKTLKDGTQAYRYQGDDGKWYKNDEEGGTGPKSAQPTPSPITDRELTGTERARFALAADKSSTQLDALKRLGYGAEEVDGEVIAIDPKTGERFRPDAKGLNWRDTLDLPAMLPEIVGATAGGAAGLASPVPGGAFIGQGVGSAAGTAARQKLAQWAGVEDPERSLTDRAVDLGISGAAGALVPAALSKGLPFAKTALTNAGQKIASKAPGLASFAEGTANAVKAIPKIPVRAVERSALLREGSLSRMASKEGDLALPMVKNVQKALRETADELGGTIEHAKAKLHKEYVQGLKALGLQDEPVNTLKNMGDAADLADHYGFFKYGDKGSIGSQAEIDQITKFMQEATDPNLTYEKAEHLLRRMNDAIKWGADDAKIKTNEGKSMLQSIWRGVRQSLNDTATAKGKGAEFEALKKGAEQNIEMFDNLRGFLGSKGEKSLRTLENEANWNVDDALSKLESLVPGAKPSIDKARAASLAYDFAGGGAKATLGADRIMGPVMGIGVYQNPAIGLPAYIATRPQVLSRLAGYGGKAARGVATLPPIPMVTNAAKTVGSAAVPPIKAAASAAAPRIAAMGAQQIPQIGNPSRSVEIDQSPRELMGDKWADAQKVITTAYGRDVKALIDAGESPEEATTQVLRALAQKHRYNAKNLPGTFAGVVKQVQAAAKEQYGQDITRSQAIELLAGAQ